MYPANRIWREVQLPKDSCLSNLQIELKLESGPGFMLHAWAQAQNLTKVPNEMNVKGCAKMTQEIQKDARRNNFLLPHTSPEPCLKGGFGGENTIGALAQAASLGSARFRLPAMTSTDLKPDGSARALHQVHLGLRGA